MTGLSGTANAAANGTTELGTAIAAALRLELSQKGYDVIKASGRSFESWPAEAKVFRAKELAAHDYGFAYYAAEEACKTLRQEMQTHIGERKGLAYQDRFEGLRDDLNGLLKAAASKLDDKLNALETSNSRRMQAPSPFAK